MNAWSLHMSLSSAPQGAGFSRFPSQFTARQRGGPGPSDLGRKRCQTPKGVSIAIATMEWGAIAGMDAFHHPRPGREFKVAIRLDGDPSQVGAPLHAFGDHRPHHVAGPKAM